MAAVVSSSIELQRTPGVVYVLRVADTCLIHAQRLLEWCGHGPVLEEDMAISNMALDLLGQARHLLSHAGSLDGQRWDEDQMAFLRDERDYFNLTLVEQPMRRSSAHAPGGDFADAVLRNFLLATWLKALWSACLSSNDTTLAGVAAKAVKEARYHQQHAGDWVQRLGDGTQESAARMRAALARAWPYTREMFADDHVDAFAHANGLGAARASLRAPWLSDVASVFADAQLLMPVDTQFLSAGTQGRHSEHMGFILAEMQALQRQFPGGRW
jgi:ring-1,2-phenylacetyl-CoA epoxidase subunit PaaC